MKINKMLDYIITNAPSNIQYRTRKEILNEPINTPHMLTLQSQILNLPKVQKAFACQRENGFFGSVIHGVPFDGFDSTVDLLKRNGVELTEQHMIKAKGALTEWADFKKDHFYKAGNAMDEHGRGGFRAIWAEQLVELGADEAMPQIKEQVNIAIDAFRGALDYSTPDDFSRKATFKGSPCRYYIKGAKFPAANHIRILEKTLSWRTADNIEMVRRSFKHCEEIMSEYKDGPIYVNCGYFVGPFNYNWNGSKGKFAISDFDNSPMEFAWFMKGLGSASKIYPLFNEASRLAAESLIEYIESDQFINGISSEHVRLFKNYASIAPSWRKKESVVCDLCFPILLYLSKIGAVSI